MAVIGTWSNSSGSYNWQTTRPSAGPYHIVALQFNGGTLSAGGSTYTDSLTTYLQYFDQDAYTCQYGATTFKINGTVTRSGYTWSSLSVTGVSGRSNTTSTGFKVTGFTNDASMGITWNWTQNSTPVTYTRCTAPTSTSVNATSIVASSSNKITYSWSGAAGGTNNSITGYWITVTDNGSYSSSLSKWITSTSTSGSTTFSTAGLGGHTLTFKIKTCGTAGESYQSGYTSAKTVTITNPVQTTYTISFYLNETDTSAYSTKTANYGTQVTCPIPTKTGYIFRGWYTPHASNKTATTTPLSDGVITYGEKYAYTQSISTSFSTYMSNYAIQATGSYDGQAADGTPIFSMTEGCGYSFLISQDGSTIGFETQTKTGGYDGVYVSTSEVSPGWHDWNCIFDGDNKKLYLYMDGVLKGTANTSWDHINWTPDYGTNTSATMNLLVAAEYTPRASDQIGWYNFTGKVGNFFITESTTPIPVDYSKTIMPKENIKMYARWEKIVYIYTNEGEWVPAKPYIYKNSTRGWTPADPYVYNGSAWK